MTTSVSHLQEYPATYTGSPLPPPPGKTPDIARVILNETSKRTDVPTQLVPLNASSYTTTALIKCLENLFNADRPKIKDVIAKLTPEQKKSLFESTKITLELYRYLTMENLIPDKEITIDFKYIRNAWSDRDYMTKLLQKGKRLEILTHEGKPYSFVLYAIDHDSPELLQLLIDQRYEKNMLPNQTYALDYALTKGHIQCAEILFRAKAKYSWKLLLQFGNRDLIETYFTDYQLKDAGTEVICRGLDALLLNGLKDIADAQFAKLDEKEKKSLLCSIFLTPKVFQYLRDQKVPFDDADIRCAFKIQINKGAPYTLAQTFYETYPCIDWIWNEAGITYNPLDFALEQNLSNLVAYFASKSMLPSNHLSCALLRRFINTLLKDQTQTTPDYKAQVLNFFANHPDAESLKGYFFTDEKASIAFADSASASIVDFEVVF